MENKEFYLDLDGFKLHSKLDFPKEAKEKMPLVILIHGLTGNLDEPHTVAIAEGITNNGFACLRVDMYGHGKSDGKFINHNVMIWVHELLYIIDYARELDFVTNIYLAGHSQGGLTAILAGALKQDQIKALLPLSPAIIIATACKVGRFFDYEFDSNNIPETVTFWDTNTVNSNYIRVARALPVDEAIATFTKPVFLLQGEQDESVPAEDTIELNNRFVNSELTLIKDSDHCYNGHFDEAVNAINSFLNKMEGL